MVTRRLFVVVAAGVAVLWLAASVSAGFAKAPQGGGIAAERQNQVGLTSLARAHAERLLRDRLACLGCHRLGDEGGRIGPALDGIQDRMTAARALSMIRDPAGTLPGTIMPRQPMPERDARRLVAYLFAGQEAPRDRPLAPRQAPPDLLAEQPADGATLYARHCAACHGPEGHGDGWNAPALPVRPTAHADADLMSRRPDDTLFDAIAAGAYILGGSPRMPAFGEMLDTDQIRALVRYIRSLCACEQPAWAGDVGGP